MIFPALKKHLSGCAFLLLAFAGAQAWAVDNPKSFAYVDTSYIITVELAGEAKFVVNFINLSDFVLVVQPGDFIYRSASGKYYIGQVFELEQKDPLGGIQKYSASVLLRAHSFKGLNIAGLFREQDQIEELSLLIGSKRFYLTALEKPAFENLLRKIEELDLNSSDIAQMFQEIYLDEVGEVRTADGTDEWDKDWEGLLVDGVNPPRAIKNPPIPLPNDIRDSLSDKSVKLSCLVTKNGGIRNLKVVKGVDRKLDQVALDGVTNSWVFLPATKNGEVYESLFEFKVDFIAPGQIP